MKITSPLEIELTTVRSFTRKLVVSTAAVLCLSVAALPLSTTVEAAGQHKKHYSWPYEHKPDNYKVTVHGL